MNKTKIEWTRAPDGSPGATWNPIRGCSMVSAGCTNCYAMRQAHRFSGAGEAYEGLTRLTGNGPVWTGEVRLIGEHLDDPLRWKRPRMVFVNSMSDLFHERLSYDQIRRIFNVMMKADWHVYQVLTKRAERMYEFMSRLEEEVGVYNIGHIWLGVSVEDEASASRVEWLFKSPAEIRWVSYEPALGPVDFRKNQAYQVANGGFRPIIDDLDWVVVGGESGPGARAFDITWARSAIEQCRAAGVPVFVKQMGAKPVARRGEFRYSIGRWEEDGLSGPILNDRKGGEMWEWPEDLRVREFPMLPAVFAEG